MTVTPEIISDAYREGNITALGKEPSDAQTTEALRLLNRIVSGVYGYEVGEPLYDWSIGNAGRVAETSWTSSNWTKLLQNVRMVANSTDAQTVYLPPDPDDGARVAIIDPANRLAAAPITLNGNGRYIAGAATALLDTDGLDRIWMYRADMGEWVVLTELTGDDAEEFPFPPEFDAYFITRLAMRLNPRYGRAMSEASSAELLTSLRKLRARYKQKAVVAADLGVLALTTPHYGDDSRYVAGYMGWMN